MQKDTTTVSFFSMSLAYIAGLIFFAIQQVYENGCVDDFGVIIFWSGIFELLAWLIFLVYPLKKLNHESIIFQKWIFPVVTSIYLELAFVILIGWGFLLADYSIVFVIAAVVGLTFGICYINLINNNKFQYFLSKGTLNRLVLLTPFLFLFLMLWVFPKISPSIAFRYMPDSVQDQIVEKTIPKFKEGDNFEQLNSSLPSYFKHIENGSGNMSFSSQEFSFVVQIHCNKIIRIEHSKQNNPDLTIYGKLQDINCP